MGKRTSIKRLSVTRPDDAEVGRTNIGLGNLDLGDEDLDSLLYARNVEVNTYADLTTQRATNIPALFNIFYKFIQNPSTVSVETYKRMVDTDDTIGSGVDFLTTCLAARIGGYTHPNKDIAAYVNKRLEEIEGGFFEVKKQMLSAAWAGFSVGEVVWSNTEEGFVPQSIVPLPPGTVLFETERTGKLTSDGILQYQRNYNPALMQGGIGYMNGFSATTAPFDVAFRPDPLAKLGDFSFPLRTGNIYSYMAVRIPTVKCVHYAFGAQGGFRSPYGRSLLRRIYKYYVMKDAFLQMLAIALDRKGTPLTVIFADPNLTVQDPNKTNDGANARGRTRVGKRGDVAAREAFKNVHNDTTIILPGRKGQHYDLDFVPQASNAGDFIESIKMCNQAIMRGLLIPALVFMGGDGTGSYSLGQEHSQTFDKILDGFNAGARQALLQQLVRPLIAYNFPKELWQADGLGDFSKRELTPEEVQKELAALEIANNMGGLDMNDLNDLNAVREKVNLEARETPIERELELFGGLPLDGEESGDDFGAESDNEQPNPTKPPAGAKKPAAAGSPAKKKASRGKK